MRRTHSVTSWLGCLVVAAAVASPAAAAPPNGPPGQQASDVTVVNPPDQPVPMSIVENLVPPPPFEPVNATGNGNIGSTTQNGDLNTGFRPIYDVPQDRTLVIEYATLRAGFGDIGEKVSWQIVTTAGGETAQHWVGVVENLGAGTTNTEERTGGRTVKLYADPGTTVQGLAVRAGGSGVMSVRFTISGHLIPAD